MKDVSFELPNAPQIFQDEGQVEIKMNLAQRVENLADGVHEVVLTVTVTANLAEKTAYLAEVQQAGIFVINGFNEQEMGGMLNSYCPNMLFPFAREVISDLVNKGSFPQMLLAPINFDALYAQHLQAQTAKEDGEEQPVH